MVEIHIFTALWLRNLIPVLLCTATIFGLIQGDRKGLYDIGCIFTCCLPRRKDSHIVKGKYLKCSRHHRSPVDSPKSVVGLGSSSSNITAI